MTTATVPTDARLTFGGILRSEWIKLITLRSTVWCYAIIAILTIGLGALIASLVVGLSNDIGIGATQAAIQSNWLAMATVGLAFAQLVSAVLGALVITGEYGTGMIRSTFAAVPKRVPALVGKVLVFGVVTFLVALVSLVISALLVVPIFAAHDLAVDLGDGAVWLGLVGGAAFVALIGVMSLGIGAIIRVGAGAIATSLGLLLVVPTVLQIFAQLTRVQWVMDAGSFLPSSAGAQLAVYPSEPFELPPGVLMPLALENWQAFLVMLAWAVVPVVLGAILLKRRDS